MCKPVWNILEPRNENILPSKTFPRLQGVRDLATLARYPLLRRGRLSNSPHYRFGKGSDKIIVVVRILCTLRDIFKCALSSPTLFVRGPTIGIQISPTWKFRWCATVTDDHSACHSNLHAILGSLRSCFTPFAEPLHHSARSTACPFRLTALLFLTRFSTFWSSFIGILLSSGVVRRLAFPKMDTIPHFSSLFNRKQTGFCRHLSSSIGVFSPSLPQVKCPA